MCRLKNAFSTFRLKNAAGTAFYKETPAPLGAGVFFVWEKGLGGGLRAGRQPLRRDFSFCIRFSTGSSSHAL